MLLYSISVAGVATLVHARFVEKTASLGRATPLLRPMRQSAKANVLHLDPGDRVLLSGRDFKVNLRLTAEDAGKDENLVVVGSYSEGRTSIETSTERYVSVYNAGGVKMSILSTWTRATPPGAG